MMKNDWLDPARRWQTFGGGGLIVVGAILAVRSLAIATSGSSTPLDEVLRVLDALALLAACVFLAYGSTGANGIVGASRARAAILGIGIAGVIGVAPVGDGGSRWSSRVSEGP